MADFEARIKRNRAMGYFPTQEPVNPGPSLAQFVRIVDGMGERAKQRGTIALSVRRRKLGEPML